METEMGTTWCNAQIANALDLGRVTDGVRTDVRNLTLECLVDTGASKLFLPQSIVDQLGLERVGKRNTRTGGGEVERWAYSPVMIEIMGRSTSVEPIAVPDDARIPPIVGYLILEDLALMVNPLARALVPTPETRDHYFVEMY